MVLTWYSTRANLTRGNDVTFTHIDLTSSVDATSTDADTWCHTDLTHGIMLGMMCYTI
jgi:hypothetical protein